ncbi:uncharacterized protein LOC6638277 isoform X1 [Drosophila willistoni]|nr:uncharacterized protein LOC6638277 isoform X1 [Drosophila willistoni]
MDNVPQNPHMDKPNIQVDSVVYDYMKYPNNKSVKLGKRSKLGKSHMVDKRVSFKHVVEIISFNDNWKMQMSESQLSSEEDQGKRSMLQRNY